MFSTPVKQSARCSLPRTPVSGKKLNFGASPLTPRRNASIVGVPKSVKHTPKSSIYRSSPLKLEVVHSDWALTGTGNAASIQTPGRQTRKRVARSIAQADRFIPTRNASSTAASKIDSRPGSSNSQSNTLYDPSYQSSVAEACGLALNTRILAFKPEAPESSRPVDLRSQYNRPLKPAAQAAQFRRRVLTAPERVLDAPGIVDDYYLNLLDWSNTNQVAIGLERSVYVWNADTGNVVSLLESREDTYISGLKWSGDGSYLAVGLGDGDVQIWDAVTSQKMRSMNGHDARVGVLSWDKHMLSSGCRDGSIWNHDVRVAKHKIAELNGHGSEVCGLEWRSDGAQLASGGNDNLVNIWDARSSVPKFTKTNHRAAVKALAWCPWQLNLLSTGGGSYDKHIHFWNSTTGARVNSIDTGSQVTSLRWSPSYREIVSSHGFPDNHLAIWAYPSLAKTVEISAHETRVLHSTLSPDGQVLATAAADENLKFWRVFEAAKKSASGMADGKKSSEMAKAMTTIR
ncbi:WD repeat-containing protein slp1 [Neolecta irregularis DAH-3]|uniref:WD repeat-containing protein slp1 n=1 Tax=Neolecta irregularis (strain DAH-3) TaxID=1198029 RepID=A0A1U7LKD8_NEOID|nr:WD repeat-containing protein slp1 [Neolecta irregularis DAH-3]|eukprot:OLL23126.1 WD repeat-containing protein slp1 [Neolecta irregularis DAH-3]